MTADLSTASRDTLVTRDGQRLTVHRVGSVPGADRMPYALKILLENVLRHGGPDAGVHVAALTDRTSPRAEILFRPGRVLLHDTTGVPALVDLAAMRSALAEVGHDPRLVNPQIPVHLVTDHSITVDAFGTRDAVAINTRNDLRRNAERYRLLRWAENAFDDFAVVPPGSGIMHQINLEYLSSVVGVRDGVAFPDTLVGADSHTTMVNGLGVLAWGVGGIEAEVAMLGEPLSLVVPRVVGVRLHNALHPGVTSTDLVLTLTERLRQVGVVGAFVEFLGEGVASTSLATRATVANMSPEYGSTCAVFPVDQTALDYLDLVGRDESHVSLVERYARLQGLWHDPRNEATYDEVLDFDLAAVTPSVAGPTRPQDRLGLAQVASSVRAASRARGRDRTAVSRVGIDDTEVELGDGAVAIAAITSCTNTSNPDVMVAAALLARNAVARGLRRQPWVKTSLAPGSRVVMTYLERSGLLPSLETLGFGLVGYGCTTCIGNSGPLLPEVSAAVHDDGLIAAAVLSGNRNFGGRINPDVELSYLASPPLVVAHALAGTTDIDLTKDPIGIDADGHAVLLADVWPSEDDVASIVAAIGAEMFREAYADLFSGTEEWQAITGQERPTFDWDPDSTYVRRPPFVPPLTTEAPALRDIEGARVLALLGDSVTTDHLSPSGIVTAASPAGRYLAGLGVPRSDVNSYPSRRGNFEVMARGTLANVRVQNRLAPGTSGSATLHLPDGEPMSIYDAAQRYAVEGVPLLIVAGRDYGNGSSRDWAAKGPRMLGVRAVIAESFERIHRSNLVGMGVLPLQFRPGDSAAGLGLTGHEAFTIRGLSGSDDLPAELTITADGIEFVVGVRVDTPTEVAYLRAGGVLPYVMRQLVQRVDPGGRE